MRYPYDSKSCREVWDAAKKINPDKSPSELIDIYLNGKTIEEFDNDIRAVNNFGLEIVESPPDFVSGCYVLVETEFIKNIGGFSDTRFNLYGCEDVDRCWRIGTAGFKVARTSSVFVHHFEGMALNNNNLDWKKLLWDNNRLLIAKWSDKFWDIIRKEIASGQDILEIVRRHWIIEWLLQSVDDKVVPDDLQLAIKQCKEKTASHFPQRFKN